MGEPDRTKRYEGAGPTETAKAFLADAEDAARFGWAPISQAWDGPVLTVRYRKGEATPEAPQPPSQPAAEPVPEPEPLPDDVARAYVGTPPRSVDTTMPRQEYVPDRLATDAPLSKPGDSQRAVVYMLGAIAVLVAIVAFWVIATPHEQCYIGRSLGGFDTIIGTEWPIERTGPDTYRGVPSEFQGDGVISADAAIECRWELGQPYRVTLFGG
jgi:hypothetical protein